MSWLFSQALVEAFLVDCSLDGLPSARLSMMDTPQPFLRNGKTMDFSRLSQSGLTFAALTAQHGAALLTWFREDFLAKISRLQARVKALRAPDLASGASSSVSFAKFDHASHTWRTAQRSLLGDSHEYLLTLPRSGEMRDGALLERTIKVLGTNEIASGLLQTLVADDAVERAAGKWNSRGEPKLSAQVMLLPTLTVFGNNIAKGSSPQAGDGLATALKKLPTITVQDSKNNGNRSSMGRNTKPLNAEVGGPLNPEWCEWFMGWPIGWTGLEPLAMDKFQSWLNAHGRP